ncbi:major facilitator superfamily domain-containing protein [Geopyxis carbonaria]|nr:major facilitator superfamily domain-containing protein [Geopyxis carbonaria]
MASQDSKPASLSHASHVSISLTPPPSADSTLERTLVRKIDARLLPMVVLMYILNYLDRNNIAAARLAGLEDELALTGTQYQTSVSILFVGYILMQIPSNMFLDKIGRPSLYLPTCMVLWGVISTATSACQSFGGLLACRFVLGFIEAAYFPGCLFYLSTWYTRRELGFRTAILYSGSLISGAFSGLITAGITSGMDGVRGLRAWRWLFIIEGAVTIAVALAAFWVLPDFPKTTAWLSDAERELAMRRLAEEAGEADEDAGRSVWAGLREAAGDGKTYLLGVTVFGMVSSGTVTNFFPTVVETLGYSRTVSLLLTAPPYALAVITTFANSRHADVTGERYLHVVGPLLFAIPAFIIAATTSALAPRYLAMMLMVPGVYSGYVVALAWISNCLPRPPAKRAAALAAINAVSNSSSIWSSYYYPKSAGPQYRVAMGINCGTALLAFVSASWLRIRLGRDNRRLERGEKVHGVGEGMAREGFRFLV